jgi:predicted small secreted protein
MRRVAAARLLLALTLLAPSAALAGCGTVRGNKAGEPAPAHGVSLHLHTGHTGDFAPGPTFNDANNPFNEWSITSGLLDSHGRPAGHQEVNCVTSPYTKTNSQQPQVFTCFRVLMLARGEIAAQTADSVHDFAVVGGTGVYEGARGTMRVTQGGPRPEQIAIDLLPERRR